MCDNVANLLAKKWWREKILSSYPDGSIAVDKPRKTIEAFESGRSIFKLSPENEQKLEELKQKYIAERESSDE